MITYNFNVFFKVIHWNGFFQKNPISLIKNEIPKWNNADRHLSAVYAVSKLSSVTPRWPRPLVCAQVNSEGVWSLKWRVPLKSFNFWAKMPLFDTNCFMIRFQLQMTLQKQQRKPQQKTHTPPNVRLYGIFSHPVISNLLLFCFMQTYLLALRVFLGNIQICCHDLSSTASPINTLCFPFLGGQFLRWFRNEFEMIWNIYCAFYIDICCLLNYFQNLP